ncbi:hypothetical protein OBBRIDRAFT_130797 [Obba rivulosa]|uniref:Uncharacterized protein n=1 Tax=Obba rivulosa TaxID=1052685 RepID=A0A8E2AP97_9APHY|nr:hypothetical protein OBBRIDRAFT_130797 [Obba rivulosa]
MQYAWVSPQSEQGVRMRHEIPRSIDIGLHGTIVVTIFSLQGHSTIPNTGLFLQKPVHWRSTKQPSQVYYAHMNDVVQPNVPQSIERLPTTNTLTQVIGRVEFSYLNSALAKHNYLPGIRTLKNIRQPGSITHFFRQHPERGNSLTMPDTPRTRRSDGRLVKRPRSLPRSASDVSSPRGSKRQKADRENSADGPPLLDPSRLPVPLPRMRLGDRPQETHPVYEDLTPERASRPAAAASVLHAVNRPTAVNDHAAPPAAAYSNSQSFSKENRPANEEGAALSMATSLAETKNLRFPYASSLAFGAPSSFLVPQARTRLRAADDQPAAQAPFTHPQSAPPKTADDSVIDGRAAVQRATLPHTFPPSTTSHAEASVVNYSSSSEPQGEPKPPNSIATAIPPAPSTQEEPSIADRILLQAMRGPGKPLQNIEDMIERTESQNVNVSAAIARLEAAKQDNDKALSILRDLKRALQPR